MSEARASVPERGVMLLLASIAILEAFGYRNGTSSLGVMAVMGAKGFAVAMFAVAFAAKRVHVILLASCLWIASAGCVLVAALDGAGGFTFDNMRPAGHFVFAIVWFWGSRKATQYRTGNGQ